MKTKRQFHIKHYLAAFIVPGFLLLTILLSGLTLSSSLIYADNSTSKTSNVAVVVNTACTITTGGGIHSKTIDPGTSDTIEGNPINVSCNDTGGYALYAVGFSGDSYDTPSNTKMLSSLGSNDIPTATSGASSYWAMKATPSGTDIPTIDNSYNSFQVIPATYTKISHYPNITVGATNNNSVTTPTYKINIMSNQPAATYVGKVKYTLVHPTTAPEPSTKTIANATYMQEVGSCPSTLTTGMVYELTDNRDNQKYLVARLKDGNCWMLQNLKLGRSTSTLTLTPANSDVDGNYILDNKLPSPGKFHSYTIDGVQYQNNSTEYYCTGDGTASDWESCYYNWYTATAGTGTTYIASQGQNVNNSICPAGWTLPTQPQFQQLYNQYPSVAQMEVANPTTTKENTPTVGQVTNTPGFLISGRYGTGGASNLGSRGYYWSRTAYSAQNAYGLYMSTSSVSPAGNDIKYYGFTVRCLVANQ